MKLKRLKTQIKKTLRRTRTKKRWSGFQREWLGNSRLQKKDVQVLMNLLQTKSTQLDGCFLVLVTILNLVSHQSSRKLSILVIRNVFLLQFQTKNKAKRAALSHLYVQSKWTRNKKVPIFQGREQKHQKKIKKTLIVPHLMTSLTLWMAMQRRP